MFVLVLTLVLALVLLCALYVTSYYQTQLPVHLTQNAVGNAAQTHSHSPTVCGLCGGSATISITSCHRRNVLLTSRTQPRAIRAWEEVSLLYPLCYLVLTSDCFRLLTGGLGTVRGCVPFVLLQLRQK